VPEISHRVEIAGPRLRGLVEFWTPIEGEPELGGKLNFFFGGGLAGPTEQTFRNLEVLLQERAPRWTTSHRASCISPTSPTSRRSTWFTQAGFGRDQADTNDRVCGLGGGHARRSYRYRLPSQVN
jgi:hypothetical protein